MAIKAKWQNKVDFFVGDTVKILYKIVEEGKKERVQPYQGLIIGIRGSGENKSFIVRKTSIDNIGVERTFPLNSPWITDLKIIRGSLRTIKRAKLYYLRKQGAKKSRKKV